MSLSRIQLKHIDFSDDTFSLLPSYFQAEIPASLTESIRRAGILHPPIIVEKTASSFIIIAGRQRLLAAQNITVSCDCIKLPEKTKKIDLLGIALEEALLCRPLTAIEQATFFEKALQWIDEKEIANRFLPVMGLTKSPYHIQKGLKLLELEEPLTLAVHHGQLDEKVAFELGKMAFGDRLALFDLISTLKLSVGNQKKLAVICREVATRHNSTIIEWLRTPEITKIVSSGDANIPQKTARLMKWLGHQRFPRLSQAEEEFTHFVNDLKLPQQVRLEHSSSFEKDEVQLNLTCSNKEHFLTTWEKIKDLFPPQKKGNN